ncbi:dihydroneopterin aldolase [Acidiferrobacter thiooxydans]|jgi:dihydroneopterin aldolase|uniref:7,8-dihydroneopterin aldolase n=1 Tax=Acidiferrobacter thiooxydans TaxID=163359 RepID=A0A1C2G4W5_9GAMM|nr:dihydroneopterin aldolase [Acidiferrobacter thiooxydans]MDA8118845.1 dihydroneopterin aldolase [Gammaproteobacteria bacterium]MDA8191715.1 dihydroneopterin aldolase [Gammaproteobacteria bacterium]RCN57254.1 dihydroneopterin aldolase [Acidiferrobacter thiooxydans]UEN99564.1 dihydroneopterin aldolase [Acidiferrobacter thiooxydans]
MRDGVPQDSGDVLYLHDLRVDCIIGIWDWERQTRQTIVLDLDMGVDIRAAATSDDLRDTLDYKAVAKRVIAFVEASEFRLVETLAERVAGLILREFPVPWLRLRLDKHGAIRGAGQVGLVIERRRIDP